IFLSLFITHQSSALQTDAVFEQINLNLTKDTIMLIAIGIIAFAYFAIKYKWDFNILKENQV
ncbi:MAG: hypothetical protein LBC48_03950, partial [Dysgonamonadaceae bacterium]|nr:hypothetical protein [Dysgonamonadaceae bacterium]